MKEQEGRAMAKTGTAKGLAVGVGILVGSLVGWGEASAQVSASRGMPAPSGSFSQQVQPGAQVTVPGYQRNYDRDGGRDRDRHRDDDRDRDGRWGDRGRDYRGYAGYYGKHYHPGYGYYYHSYPPYGTYPGRWVWDGRNWLFVPLY
jgi:hypothetical protein